MDYNTNNRTRCNNFKLNKSVLIEKGEITSFYNRIFDTWNNLKMDINNSVRVIDF